MMKTLFTLTPAISTPTPGWSLARLLQSLLRTRREIRRIAVLAERERLALGFECVPQRVWARRSALFIDR